MGLDPPTDGFLRSPTSPSKKYIVLSGRHPWFPKKLNLDMARDTSVPTKNLRNYNIPTRRPASQNGHGIKRRLETKNITQSLAEIEALIASSNDWKNIRKDDHAEYNIKQILLSDGEGIFDFTLRGADAAGAL